MDFVNYWTWSHRDIDHRPISSASLPLSIEKTYLLSEHYIVIQKIVYLSFAVISIFCSFVWSGGYALASSKVDQKAVPQEIISLILTHQPYMSSSFLTTNYNLAFIKNNFPDAKIDLETAKYKKEKNENETSWTFNGKKEVTQVTFKFDLSKWNGSSVEKKLLKQYKSQISPEAFSRVPSDTRIITVKDSKNKFEFDVFFPVSDYELPSIRSVSIYTKIGDK